MLKELLLSVAMVCSLQASSPITILQLGDSHTTVEAGMGKALERELGTAVQFRQIGIVGARAEQLARSLSGHGPYDLPTKSPDVILIAFGTNEYRMDPKTYRTVISGLRERYGTRIILLGPPSGKLKRIDSVVRVQSDVAKQMGVPFVDRRGNYGIGRDGVHLTISGYRKMATHTAQKVAKILK